MTTAAPPPEAQVLGQLLAAHNVFFVFSDPLRMAQFVQQAVATVPGVDSSAICIPEAKLSQLGNEEPPECRQCDVFADHGGELPKGACALSNRDDLLVLELKTPHHHWGRLLVQSRQADPFTAYRPFVSNLANCLAINIERCWQRQQLEQMNETLQQHSTQLEALNREMEAFTYSVSHDLRAPLRAIDGFSEALLEDYGDRFDDEGTHYLTRLRHGAQRMGRLIDDLLNLSRITRRDLSFEAVDLSALGREIAEELCQLEPERSVAFNIAPALTARGDRALIRLALYNLLANAWKFTSKRPDARIELGRQAEETHPPIFFVRDNGAGYDMAYSNNLFKAFHRLHREAEFSGTGVGLATVQRIVHRHGGTIWSHGEIERGATFYFTLQQNDTEE